MEGIVLFRAVLPVLPGDMAPVDVISPARVTAWLTAFVV